MARSEIANYSIAAAGLLCAMLLRWLLDPLLGEHLPLVTLYGAVAVAVWFGGYRPALLVAALGYIACHYWFIEPRLSFAVGEARNLVDLVGYLILCFIIVGFGEAFRAAQRQFIELGQKQLQMSPFVMQVEQIRDLHNVRDFSVVGFVVLAAVLAFGEVIGYLNAQRMASNERSVDHSHRVIASLDHLLSTLKDAETGQRGFLLTGDGKYLEPYSQARRVIDSDIARLKQLVAHNADQAARLSTLDETIDEKLAELERTIALVKEGNLDEALRIVRTDAGEKLMEQARKNVATMQAAANQLLQLRAAEFKSSFELSLLSIVLPAVLGVILIGFVFYLNQRNLNQRRQSAVHTAEQAERLRTTLASIGDAVITTDRAGNVTHLNAVAESLTGRTSSEAAGKPLEAVFRIINESTQAPAENPVARVLREGVIVGLANHTALIAKDGAVRTIDDSAAPIRCAEGEIVGTVLIFRDITERHRVDEQLKQRLSDARFLAAIVQSSQDAIISKSLDGIIQTWNAAAEAVFGYTAPQAIGKHISLVIPKERLDDEERIIAKLRADERVDHFETVRVRSDGRRIHVSLTISPIRDESGKVIGASKIVRDITDRVASEQAIKSQNERLRLLADAANVLLSTPDADSMLHGLLEKIGPYLGMDTYFNFMVNEAGDGLRLVSAAGVAEERMPQIRHLEFGQSISGAVALSREPMHAAHIDQSDDSNVQILKSFGIRAYYCHPLMADNLLLGTLSFGSRVKDEFSPSELVFLETVSNYVSGAYERLRLLNKLREADRRKDEFLATLAHELRNPLAPLSNMLEVLKRADGDGDLLAQGHETMERQVLHLVRLVEDLLDVSRITRNKLELRKTKVELGTAIQNALETCRPLANSRGLEINVSLPAAPIFLNADLVRLSQVFANLLNNACKYTEPGGKIWLSAEREGSDVKVTVKDTGMGIPADKLGGIFEMFSQIEGSLERSQGGLGIGLTLVKRLVEMHSGTVEAASEGPGLGSQFIVRLPIVVESHRLATAPPLDKLAGGPSRRVLVVDDNPDSATSLAMLLKIAGHETHIAHDGQEAVQAAERVRPEVVLMDIGLPSLNGYEACRRIRSNSWGQDMVLVAVTGWGQESDRDKSKEAGFDHHMVKPVDLASLKQVLLDGRSV